METLQKVNLSKKFAQFSDHWNPKIIGELNGQHVKAVKLKGEFVWHHHDNEDELFRHKRHFDHAPADREIVIEPGEFVIVPRGFEHQPYAPQEVHVILFEPASTLNTGNVVNERTVNVLEKM